MKLYIKALFILIISAFNSANAEFGWYPYTIDNQYAKKLINGGLKSEQDALKVHLEKVIAFDIKDSNFPYDKDRVYKVFEKVLKSGIELKQKDNAAHEYQWYTIYALLSPTLTTDIQYESAKLKSIGSGFISAGSVDYVLSKNYLNKSKLRLLAYGKYLKNNAFDPDFSAKFENASCLDDIKFGLCIYDYIILNSDEVTVIRNELMQLKRGPLADEKYSEFFAFILDEIFEVAYKKQQAMIFYGY